MREIGETALWSISTAKPGNGVEQLRDNNLETYWQSDGSQPHTISIQFPHKVSLSSICLYLDYTLDESYSPKVISIRGGMSAHDSLDITTIDVAEPTGWVIIPLVSNEEDVEGALRCHFIQIRILAMHQSGRDTHVRQVKVFGPRSSPVVMGGFCLDDFKTVEMLQYAQIR